MISYHPTQSIFGWAGRGGGVQWWQKLRIITPDKSPLIVVDRWEKIALRTRLQLSKWGSKSDRDVPAAAIRNSGGKRL